MEYLGRRSASVYLNCLQDTGLTGIVPAHNEIYRTETGDDQVPECSKTGNFQ